MGAKKIFPKSSSEDPLAEIHAAERDLYRKSVARIQVDAMARLADATANFVILLGASSILVAALDFSISKVPTLLLWLTAGALGTLHYVRRRQTRTGKMLAVALAMAVLGFVALFACSALLDS